MMQLKTIYVIQVSNAKIDRPEEAFFYSPLVTTNLLKSFRCVQSILSEYGGNAKYEVGMPCHIRKENPQLNVFTNKEKKFHNVCIATWKIIGVNEKTLKFLRSDYAEISITAFRIDVNE